MSSKVASVSEYIHSFPVDVQNKLNELKMYILFVVPHAEDLFNYGIPAFALVKGGKREQQIMFAGYKNHIGLYPHPTTIEHFHKELIQYKTAKGSIQFPIDKELPKALIIDMIRYRYELILKVS
jgi:uncharacterized protein YdhG (YjbR/CyaY superfamily)